jgi:hypothetical protein
MRAYLVTAFVLALALPAAAQNRMPQTIPYKDSKTGETIGTATFSGNTLYLRKSDGELIGSVVTAPDGSRTLYDPSGNVMGVTRVPAGPPAGRP